MKVLQLATGLLVATGAAIAWHYWHIDGLLAALVAFGGLAVAYSAFGQMAE